MRTFKTPFAAGWSLIVLLAMPVMAGDDAQSLIARLQDADEDVRYQAAFALGELESPGPEVATALKAALTDDAPYVRIAAAHAFLRAGGDIAAVEPLLGDSDESVQLAIARGLVIDGRKLEPAVQALLALAADGDEWVDAKDTLQAFSEQRARQSVPVLLDVLARAHNSVEQHGPKQALLGMDGLHAEHVPELSQLLKHYNSELRATAAMLMSTLGPDAAAGVPALKTALRDPVEAVRVQAALALLRIPVDQDAAITELQGVLDESHSESRPVVVSALTEIEDPPHALIPGLVRSLGVVNQFERWNAVEVLTAIGPDAVPPLIAEVESPDALSTHVYLWVSIANILGQPENRSDQVVSALLKLTQNDDADVKIAAINALAITGVGSAPAVSRMIELLGATPSKVEMAAVNALAAATGDDEQLRAEARSALSERLNHAEPPIRIAAAESQFELGEDPARLLPILKPFLASDDGECVEAALKVYEELGPRAAPAIPDLIAAFDTQAAVSAGFSGYALHQSVPRTLARVGPAAIPSLVAKLQDPNPQVRGHAAETLGLIGPDAAVAAEPLSQLFRDKGEHLATMGCMGFNVTVADDALTAVALFGPKARAAFPQLATLMKEQPLDEIGESQTGFLIADALGAVGPDAAGAVPWLRDLDTKVDRTWKQAKVRIAIARIAPEDPQGIADIQKVLQWYPQEDPLLDLNSITTIEDLMEFIIEAGPRSQAFIPNLRYLIWEAPLLTPEFRKYAAYALARVDPGNADAVRFLRRQVVFDDRDFPIWEARELLDRLVQDGVISSATE